MRSQSVLNNNLNYDKYPYESSTYYKNLSAAPINMLFRRSCVAITFRGHHEALSGSGKQLISGYSPYRYFIRLQTNALMTHSVTSRVSLHDLIRPCLSRCKSVNCSSDLILLIIKPRVTTIPEQRLASRGGLHRSVRNECID